MVHGSTASEGNRASTGRGPATRTDRCIDRGVPDATRLAVAQAIGNVSDSGERVAVMRVRICPRGTMQTADAEWARLAAALAGRIACGKDDWGPLPDGDRGFAVVLGAVGDRLSALTRAHRMVAALELPMHGDGPHPEFTAAIGIGLFPEDGTDAEDLLGGAAHALSDLCRSRQGAVGFRFRRASGESARRSPAMPDAHAPAPGDS